MSKDAEGDRAIAALNGTDLDGRTLNVSEAGPKSRIVTRAVQSAEHHAPIRFHARVWGITLNEMGLRDVKGSR